MTKVFIDGSAGTTGLRIYDRLKDRKDIELLILPDDKRKDPLYIKEYLNNSDITFLCLPDDAAKEAVTFKENESTVIIDTSTAHRTDSSFVYGLPELTGQKDKIRNAKLIANPGCHATGFISLVAPLVEKGVISSDAFLSCTSITGYSGGGKKMIADYESTNDPLLSSPRAYGLGQTHKHLKEMKVISKLNNEPIFIPVVSNFYSGMQVTVPLFSKDINCSFEELKTIYKEYYKDGLISFKDSIDKDGFISSTILMNKDNLYVTVTGNEERMNLVSVFDNLGKGASGAAIQNMNIVLGLDEKTGLDIAE